MGEYQYDASSKSFKQRSTSQIDESSYLYQFSQNTWIVGPVVGSSRGICTAHMTTTTIQDCGNPIILGD